MKFTIAKAAGQQRLDKFLASKLKTQSRAAVQKLIKGGGVLVNGRPQIPHYVLKSGDEVPVPDRPAEPSEALPRRPVAAPRVVAEQDDFLIIEKPSGLLVHPTEKNEPDTLVRWLLERYPGLRTVGEQQYRAGIIHRLDRDGSGIMVVPKNKEK